MGHFNVISITFDIQHINQQCFLLSLGNCVVVQDSCLNYHIKRLKRIFPSRVSCKKLIRAVCNLFAFYSMRVEFSFNTCNQEHVDCLFSELCSLILKQSLKIFHSLSKVLLLYQLPSSLWHHRMASHFSVSLKYAFLLLSSANYRLQHWSGRKQIECMW